MQSLDADSDIHALATYIQQHINANWDNVFQETHAKLVELYAKIGDSAYSLYGARLFQPIHAQFAAVGLRATPKLPGSLSTSREWGASERDRQRWMWSKITRAEGAPIGTIVTVFFHDHEEIRIPRAFRVIGLEQTTQGAVIKELSSRSADFAVALDMKEEIARYFASLGDDQPDHG